MAIRVSYTPVQAVGQLAQQAGQAEAAKDYVQRTHQIALQNQQLAHQREQLELQHQFQRDQDNFQAFIGLEAEKRAQGWELEKLETNSRLQYETKARLTQMAAEVEFQQELQKQVIEQQRTDQRCKALQQALEEGRISQEDFEAYDVPMSVGVSPNVIAQTIAMKSKSGDGLEELISRAMTEVQPEPTPPVSRPISQSRPGVTQPIYIPKDAPRAVRLGSESLQIADQLHKGKLITDEEYQEVINGLATGKEKVIEVIRERLDMMRREATKPTIGELMTPWGS